MREGEQTNNKRKIETLEIRRGEGGGDFHLSGSVGRPPMSKMNLAQ